MLNQNRELRGLPIKKCDILKGTDNYLNRLEKHICSAVCLLHKYWPTIFLLGKMIILISGASHTGKTLLAQKLLEKYKYPVLSIDLLKMGLIRSNNTSLTPEDDEKLEKYLWPIVREMIKTAIENKQNLIVEGAYIPFDWKKGFDVPYLRHILFYCLVMTRNYIRNHFADIKKICRYYWKTFWWYMVYKRNGIGRKYKKLRIM